MRVMTFNIRFDTEVDGENRWLHRRDFLLELIQTYTPWILGTQEGTWRQLQYMDDHLAGYGIHAPDRTEDPTCQYPTLFYKERRLRVREGGEFWLSKTPAVHRSKDWDSAFPRMMSYALLQVLTTGAQVWAVVTHLDNLGREARLRQATIIRELAARLSGSRDPHGRLQRCAGLTGASVAHCPGNRPAGYLGGARARGG